MTLLVKGVFAGIVILGGLYIYNPEYYNRVLSGIDGKIDTVTEKVNDPVARLKMEERKFKGKIEKLKDLIVLKSKNIAKIENEITKEQSKLNGQKKIFLREVAIYENKEMPSHIASKLKAKKNMMELSNRRINQKKQMVLKWKEEKKQFLETLPILKSKVEMIAMYVDDMNQRKEMAELTGDKYSDLMNIDSDIQSLLDKVDGKIAQQNVEDEALKEIASAENAGSINDSSSELITKEDLKLNF